MLGIPLAAAISLLAGYAAGVSTSSTATIAPGVEDLELAPGAGELIEDLGPMEIVEVRAVRLAEVARHDTTLRLRARELLERGATHLGEALDLLPDVVVRERGRGGAQVDLRGARKGGVLVLLDGVPISDPYNGNFDLTSIPVTDIAELRLSLAPSSPLNGPGGNGGVVEVITRAATGRPRLAVRLLGSDAPSTTGAVGGSGSISSELAIRASATGALSDRAPEGALEGDDGRGATGAVRLELGRGPARGSVDLSATRRSFRVSEPGGAAATGDPAGAVQAPGSELLVVDREDLFRGVLAASWVTSGWVLAAHGHLTVLDRAARRLGLTADPSAAGRAESLASLRAGADAHASLGLAEDLDLSLAAHLIFERAEAEDVSGRRSEGRTTIVQPAAGLSYRPLAWLTADAAIGLAVPLGIDAPPWPEARIALELLFPGLPHAAGRLGASGAPALRVVASRKGRAPTLRERYELGVGSPDLAPESTTGLEATLSYRPFELASVSVAGYLRLTDDLIRYNLTRTRLVNVGDVAVRGAELRVELTPSRALELGGLVGIARATSEDLVVGESPLDFFPEQRAELWAGLRGEGGGVIARVRYTGAREDGGASLAPYTTVDASAWARRDAWSISLRAENLLDLGYEARSGVPGYGRTLFVGLEGVVD